MFHASASGVEDLRVEEKLKHVRMRSELKSEDREMRLASFSEHYISR